MSLLNSSSEVPGEKALLIDSPGKRDKEVSSTPSNVYLLNVAFYSFALFALGQMFVAVFIAKSQAMVGDSSAMVIDSLTYLFNSYAERIKNKSLKESDDVTLSNAEKELKRLERTRQRLWLEILPPLCSVMTLIVLTIYIIVDAYNTLSMPDYDVGEDDGSGGNDEPDIVVMFIFSALNLGLDIMNVTCFARAKHAFGFAVIDKDRHRYVLAYDGSLHNEMADSMMRQQSEVDLHRLESEDGLENYFSIAGENTECAHGSHALDEGGERSEDINLNMCSAYTHVFADTLRSSAVLIAAGLSYIFKLGEPAIVDAIAALAVSLIILLSLGPLLNGILHASDQLKQLSRLQTRISSGPV